MEDISLKEALEELNKIRDQAGIPADSLRFGYGITTKFSDQLLEGRIIDLRIRNAPLCVILKYIGDQTKVRYRVGKGVVEFQDINELPPAPEELPDYDPYLPQIE